MARCDYLGAGQEHHIVEIKKNGLVIRLSDRSVWNISVGDSTKTVCWYPTMRILVEEGGGLTHPFRLKNLDTAGPDVVRASLR
jgi:hypothetical protein